MPLEALTSAEISLPAKPDALRVRERIAALADCVDLVALTDNHAGEARMSPLAAVALAREQGVRTVVHISCRDRNRLALQSQVVGAAALGAEGVLCVQGDPVEGVPRVGDLTATRLIRRVKDWAAPQPIAVAAGAKPGRRGSRSRWVRWSIRSPTTSAARLPSWSGSSPRARSSCSRR